LSNQVYELGDVALQSGTTLPGARIAYRTYGTLNASKSNAILFPTWYAAQHPDLEWVIGPQWALDPGRWFIVTVDILGNGASSSPSNQPRPFDRSRFPRVSILDNVMLQRRLLVEKLGVGKLALVLGRSMGAQLAFQWGAYYPDMVQRILALAGSARTSPHNYAFLQIVKMSLVADPSFRGGEYAELPLPALRNMRLVFDTWGLSQTWYRQGLFSKLGPFKRKEEFLERELAPPLRDPNDLLAQVATWERADISDNDRFRKDFPAALKAIRAKAIIMPSRTDCYFPPEDSEIEVAGMPDAELRVVPSVWGHRAAAPGTDPEDIRFFDRAIRDLLAS
jgi:homoserine O-acetyltransferase